MESSRTRASLRVKPTQMIVDTILLIRKKICCGEIWITPRSFRWNYSDLFDVICGMLSRTKGSPMKSLKKGTEFLPSIQASRNAYDYLFLLSCSISFNMLEMKMMTHSNRLLNQTADGSRQPGHHNTGKHLAAGQQLSHDC